MNTEESISDHLRVYPLSSSSASRKYQGLL